MTNMVTMTHDEGVKLHMGKFEEIKSILMVVSSDYKKTYDSKVYRMREGDIKRVKNYLRDIKARTKDLTATIKQFEELVK